MIIEPEEVLSSKNGMTLLLTKDETKDISSIVLS